MSKLCHDCPHLKTSEGGRLPDGVAIASGGRFKDTPHPCHNAPTTLCWGHVRELELVRTGAAVYNGDTLRNTYTITLTTKTGVREIRGEFTADEIAGLRRGTDYDVAAILEACPVLYTEKIVSGPASV